MRKIDEIIVHCSATVEGRDYTVDDMRRWHRRRGFADVGYHYVVYRDGTVHRGRADALVGAHCRKHNRHSIGVCYIGGLDSNGKPKDTRTEAQREAMLGLLRKLLTAYPQASVHGHREFAAKDCPCFDVRQEYAAL